MNQDQYKLILVALNRLNETLGQINYIGSESYVKKAMTEHDAALVALNESLGNK